MLDVTKIGKTMWENVLMVHWDWATVFKHNKKKTLHSHAYKWNKGMRKLPSWYTTRWLLRYSCRGKQFTSYSIGNTNKKGFVGAVKMKRKKRPQQQMLCPNITSGTQLSILPALSIKTEQLVTTQAALENSSGMHTKEESVLLLFMFGCETHCRAYSLSVTPSRGQRRPCAASQERQFCQHD